MVKRFALMLMLILPLMAGCLTDSGDDDDNDGGSGLSATKYVPLVNGATYQYTETTEWVGYDTPDVSTYTTTFSGPVSINGKSYYHMIDTYDTYTVWDDTSYVRVADNTLYMIEQFQLMASKRAMKSNPDAVLALEDDEYGTEVPFIDFDAASWNIYSGTTTNEYHTTDYTWTGKYLRRESVTVPAGTFANCAVFEITMNDHSTFSYQDEPWEETWETKMTLWLAPEVGQVKISSVSSATDIDGQMQTEYTDVTVLDSYSIP